MGQPTHPLISRLGLNQLWSNTVFGAATLRYGSTAIKLWRLISTLLSAIAVTQLTPPPISRFVVRHPSMTSSEVFSSKLHNGVNSVVLRSKLSFRNSDAKLMQLSTPLLTPSTQRFFTYGDTAVSELLDHTPICSSLVCLQRGGWIVFLIAAFSHSSELEDVSAEPDNVETWSAISSVWQHTIDRWV